MKTLDYISKNELANWLGVSLSTINRKLPELPAIKLGNARKSRVIFSVPKVNEYLENLTPIKKKGVENKFQRIKKEPAETGTKKLEGVRFYEKENTLYHTT